MVAQAHSNFGNWSTAKPWDKMEQKMLFHKMLNGSIGTDIDRGEAFGKSPEQAQGQLEVEKELRLLMSW